MNNDHRFPFYLLLLLLALSPPMWAADNHDHDADGHEETEGDHEHAEEDGEHAEENAVHLKPAQMRAAGIEVQALKKQALAIEIEAPGEIQLNAYATSEVTPRIEAQVVQRFARMGERVKKGQPLVKLSSAAMAEAQGNALVAAKDWQRVRKLGEKVVSEQRYLAAKVAWQQAQARLLAYGMTAGQIDKLIRSTQVSQADGSFVLLSPQEGTVIEDDFILGQMVQPGDRLFKITDEASIWVEAQVNPGQMHAIEPGATARLRADGHWLSGRIVQIHHQLDETTRTMGVRIEVPNPEDHLHPGQFVTVFIQSSQAGAPALTLPLDAVMRSPDGDWQVFVEKEAGEFEPVEVELIRQLSGKAVIEGLPEGTRVVTRGAFFVQSELAKSGFAVHNH